MDRLSLSNVHVSSYVQVVAGCVRLGLVSAYMRLVFLLDPGARARDLEAVTRSYNLPAEGLKYIRWRNERTVARFFYTWNMIHDHFITQLQDINKVTIALHKHVHISQPYFSLLSCTGPPPTLSSTRPGLGPG